MNTFDIKDNSITALIVNDENVNNNNRLSSAKKLIRADDKNNTNERDRESFYRDLQNFHETRNTPITRLPKLNGLEVDLHLLYSEVISRGGWLKVNIRNEWDEVLKKLGINEKCVNASVAVKHIYTRYLDKYERLNFLGEDPDKVEEPDDDGRPKKWSLKINNSIAMTYNYAQHNVSEQNRIQHKLSTNLCCVSEYEKLLLSLLSPLPNEQDFAINVCTLMTNETKHTLRLSHCPKLLDALIAHAGVYCHYTMRELFHHFYVNVRKQSLQLFWKDCLYDKMQILKLSYDDFSLDSNEKRCDQSNDNNLLKSKSDLINEELCDHELNNLDFLSLGRGLGTQDYIGQRVQQIASIIRNLSFFEENTNSLASNRTFIRFIVLSANIRWGSIHQMVFDACGNIATEIELCDPTVDNLTNCLMSTICDGIEGADRFVIISCLEILNKLSLKNSNEKYLNKFFSQNLYNRLSLFLSLNDIMLVLYTLECIYSLTNMGHISCNYLIQVRGIVDTLVSLITIEAASYGSEGCIQMRVVETVPGNMLPMVAQNIANIANLHKQHFNEYSNSPSHLRGHTGQETQKQIVQDNDQFAMSWLSANFEPIQSTESRIEQQELYKMYVSFSQKMNRRTVVSHLHFPQLVRSIFGATVGPNLVTTCDPFATTANRFYYVCLRARANPLPMQVKSGVNHSPQKSTKNEGKVKKSKKKLKQEQMLLQMQQEKEQVLLQQQQKQGYNTSLVEQSNTSTSSVSQQVQPQEQLPPQSQQQQQLLSQSRTIQHQLQQQQIQTQQQLQPAQPQQQQQLQPAQQQQMQQQQLSPRVPQPQQNQQKPKQEQLPTIISNLQVPVSSLQSQLRLPQQDNQHIFVNKLETSKVNQAQTQQPQQQMIGSVIISHTPNMPQTQTNQQTLISSQPIGSQLSSPCSVSPSGQTTSSSLIKSLLANKVTNSTTCTTNATDVLNETITSAAPTNSSCLITTQNVNLHQVAQRQQKQKEMAQQQQQKLSTQIKMSATALNALVKNNMKQSTPLKVGQTTIKPISGSAISTNEKKMIITESLEHNPNWEPMPPLAPLSGNNVRSSFLVGPTLPSISGTDDSSSTSITSSIIVSNPTIEENQYVSFEGLFIPKSKTTLSSSINEDDNSKDSIRGSQVIFANQMLADLLDKKSPDPPLITGKKRRHDEDISGLDSQNKRLIVDNSNEGGPVTPSKNAANLYAEIAASILEDEDLEEETPLSVHKMRQQQQQQIQQQQPMKQTVTMQMNMQRQILLGANNPHQVVLSQSGNSCIAATQTSGTTIKTDQGLQTVPMIIQKQLGPGGQQVMKPMIQQQQAQTQYVLATNPQSGQTYLVAQQPPPQTQTVLLTQTPQQQGTPTKTIIILQQQGGPPQAVAQQQIIGSPGSTQKVIMTTQHGQQMIVTQVPRPVQHQIMINQTGPVLQTHGNSQIHHITHQQSSPMGGAPQMQLQQKPVQAPLQVQSALSQTNILSQLPHIPATIKLHQSVITSQNTNQKGQQTKSSVSIVSKPIPQPVIQQSTLPHQIKLNAENRSVIITNNSSIDVPIRNPSPIVQNSGIPQPQQNPIVKLQQRPGIQLIQSTPVTVQQNSIQANQLPTIKSMAVHQPQISVTTNTKQVQTSLPPQITPALQSTNSKDIQSNQQKQIQTNHPSVIQSNITAIQSKSLLVSSSDSPVISTATQQPVQSSVQTTLATPSAQSITDASTIPMAGQSPVQLSAQPPVSSVSTTVLPSVPPTVPKIEDEDLNWLWVCDWRNCPRKKFKSLNDVYRHACLVHCPDHLDPSAEIYCQWGCVSNLCDGVPRKRFSLMTHLSDRHCTIESFKAAVQRRLMSGSNTPTSSTQPVIILKNSLLSGSTDTRGTASPTLSTSSSSSLPSTASAAMNAIKRHTVDLMNAKELLDENEGPVTKSIRLTAALVLRNLVTHTTAAKKTLRQHEAHLAGVALSNVESSRTVSQILFELNN